MSENAEQTPIDRPLTRADLNDIRKIVHNMAERQIAQFEGMEEMKIILSGFSVIHDRTMRIEQRLWVPSAVSAFLLLVNVLVTMLR